EQESPVLRVTPSSASEPKPSPHTPPSPPPPRLHDTRRSVLRDDSETSRSHETVME
ncbi:semaphorin-6D isoform X1, partial [Clarias magur]